MAVPAMSITGETPVPRNSVIIRVSGREAPTGSEGKGEGAFFFRKGYRLCIHYRFILTNAGNCVPDWLKLWRNGRSVSGTGLPRWQ